MQHCLTVQLPLAFYVKNYKTSVKGVRKGLKSILFGRKQIKNCEQQHAKHMENWEVQFSPLLFVAKVRGTLDITKHTSKNKIQFSLNYPGTNGHISNLMMSIKGKNLWYFPLTSRLELCHLVKSLRISHFQMLKVEEKYCTFSSYMQI